MSPQRYHSVILDEEACKGCTVCVTTCPAEAIRVRDGKARILAERCIDCGECIRRCPHHAKKARSDDFPSFAARSDGLPFDFRIALPAPSFYGQFPAKYSIPAIHAALLELGFDAVFPVAAATPAIAAASGMFLDRDRYPSLPRPLISSSCPTIIKLIQIRFPTLLGNIVPVIAPVELAGQLARRIVLGDISSGAIGGEREAGGLSAPQTVGCFFISPCPGKITETVAPMDSGNSSIDGVFAMKDVHLPVLQGLSRGPSPKEGVLPSSPAEIAWGRAGGEAEATLREKRGRWIAVDGMDQCVKILESVENGEVSDIDFLELMACTGGCVGGALTAGNPAIARHTLEERERLFAQAPQAGDKVPSSDARACLHRDKYPARPALLLDQDYRKAMDMMERMEEIHASLPGLDCGCCGAPNCHALAEDIVRGTASRTDCVIILKEQYRELVEKGPDKNG